MTPPDDDDAPAQFASPACLMHEVDPAYMGNAGPALPTPETLARLGGVLLRDIPDAVIFADQGGAIAYWNAGAERIFGFTAAEAVGQSLDIIIPDRLRARHAAGFNRMMATGQATHPPEDILSVPAMTKSGETLSIQFTVAPVTDANGALTGVLAVLRDATATFAELKRLRAALK